jgi:hypothetical protein
MAVNAGETCWGECTWNKYIIKIAVTSAVYILWIKLWLCVFTGYIPRQDTVSLF